MSINLRAFLYLIRACEGTAGEDGYRKLFGGQLFDSFADHPRRVITASLGGSEIKSSAAGAYQFLSRTWDECAKALNLPDFSPESQDQAAIFLIKRRGALEDVEAGRIEDALKKCNKEWASLPGSPYGQPTKSLAECLATYHRAGGEFIAAQQDPPKATPIPMVPTLPFILKAVLPSIISAIPSLGKLFGSGSEVSERNLKAAEVVGNIVVEATGAANLQEATEKLLSDPAAANAARNAIESRWYELVESGGGGIEGARKANLEASGGSQSVWRQPAMIMSLVLTPLIYYCCAMVLQFGEFSQETKSMVVTAVIVGVLGAVTGFFLGSSVSSRAKDDILARK